jgi:4-hydroxybenzoate polyprenyltransferase
MADVQVAARMPSPSSVVLSRDSGDDAAAPLVVDVDSALARQDPLWEALFQLVLHRPRAIPGLLRAALRGRAEFREFSLLEAENLPDALPLVGSVLELITNARKQNREVVFASSADERYASRLAERLSANLKPEGLAPVLCAPAALHVIRERFPVYDYVGSSRSDLPLWTEARQIFVVGRGAVSLSRVRRVRPDLVLLEDVRHPWHAWIRAMRPHQWAKNLLLVLPALAAHLAWTPSAALMLIAGFLAFSFTASAIYVVNDLVDLPHDRVHATKRARPIAAGELSIPGALLLASGLVVAAALVATQLPAGFQAVLAIYLVLTTAYSFALKKEVVLDVICLACLYALRVVAGGELLGISLSRWFLAFSIFVFFSLALIKRVVELHTQNAVDRTVPGRGYSPGDLPVLIALGAAAVGASSLVYCLYIMSPDVILYYTHPDLLWFGLLILLYWQARAWLLAARATMDQDPVVFALRDRASYVTLAAFLFTVWLAA